MRYIRNMLFFSAMALIAAACGGGNTTIADNANTGGGTTGGVVSGGSASNSTGTVTLVWSAPATLADGVTAVSLSDITGYKISYGPSATNTPNVVNINDGTTTQYTITLPAGSYYFIINAIDSTGNLGLSSVALQKTI